MIANTITVFRLLLTFVIVALLGVVNRNLDYALIASILLVFALDTLDGYIARKLNETSKLGEVLDVLADRIIENIFWIYFAAVGSIPVWVPIVIMARGVITDSNLHQFLGYLKRGWTHALMRSRISRTFSGTIKMLAFASLAGARLANSPAVKQMSIIFASIAVGYCLLYSLFALFETVIDLRLKRLIE